MEATYSQTLNGTRVGPTTQGVNRNVELDNGKTLQIRSSGRSHCLSVALLAASEEANQATGASLSSRRVEGAVPEGAVECIDAIVTLGGQRFHVKGSGRSHYVALKVV